ncbi:hypothetical protein Ddc_15927 [Ditylenchus destructor]|nr:hypothetical protein Ddc_15927 [Ditylenchus destructor]
MCERGIEQEERKMPHPKSKRVERYFCCMPAQQFALLTGIFIPIGVTALAALGIESHVYHYNVGKLRWLYILPASSLAAGIFTVVAFFVKISWAYAIAAALNLIGWLVILGGLIVSWIYFLGTLATYHYISWLTCILITIACDVVLELALCFAHLDRLERETRPLDDTSSTSDTTAIDCASQV